MAQTITTRCVIAGGGPAGMMLGFLLARAGIDVTVLEKHKDFLRDFRGDTVHPSTLELMHELGLLEEFLKLPHQEVSRLTFQVGAERIPMIDFSHLPTRCKFVALMPQWDFLDFLARQGKRYPKFHLHMQTEAIDLISEGDSIVGLLAKSPDGDIDIRADLVVGCDGRHSTLRERAGLTVDGVGAPIDVLWFRLSRKTGDIAWAASPMQMRPGRCHSRSRSIATVRSLMSSKLFNSPRRSASHGSISATRSRKAASPSRFTASMPPLGMT